MNNSLTAIENNIISNKILDVISSIDNLIEEKELWQYKIKLKEIESTYHQLLNYFASSVKDENRDNVIRYIKNELLSIARSVFDDINAKANHLHIYKLRNKYNNQRYIKSYIQDLEQIIKENKSYSQEYYKIAENIFEYIVAQKQISPEDSKDIFSINDKNILYITMSALMLSAIEYWDISKLDIILKIAISNKGDESIEALSIMAILLISWKNPLAFDLDINKIAGIWDLYKSEIEGFEESYSLAFEHFCKIMPIENAHIEFEDKIKNSASKIESTSIRDLEKKIEELKSKMDNSEVMGEILKEQGDIQENIDAYMKKGGDMSYISFKAFYKHPFFRNLLNYFIPFEIEHFAFDKYSDKHKEILSNLNRNFCNIDMYSLALSIQSMPFLFNDFDSEEFQMRLEGLGIKKYDDKYSSRDATMLSIIDSYYRFAYNFYDADNLSIPFLSPYRPVYKDISYTSFTNLDKISKNILSNKYINNEEYLAPIYHSNPKDPILISNYAKSLEIVGDPYKAIEVYKKYLEFDTSDDTLIAIGDLYSKIDSFETSNRYYKLVEAEDRVVERILRNYWYLDDYKEILKHIEYFEKLPYSSTEMEDFKVDALINLSRLDEAEKILLSLLSERSQENSILLIKQALIHISRGETKEALSLISEAKTLMGKHYNFDDEIEHLFDTAENIAIDAKDIDLYKEYIKRLK